MPNLLHILPTGAPAPEATYRAYALQPGLETLLAEGIGNEKGECTLEYEWNNGRPLHVQVREFAFDGAPLGVSAIVYNAKTNEQLRFNVAAHPIPKEYEGIIVVLRRILPEGHALSVEDIEMVEKSLESFRGVIPGAYRALVTGSRLKSMIWSRGLAEETGLQESICYAIIRGSGKKWTASALLAKPDAQLAEWINKAVADNIIASPEEPVRAYFDAARHVVGLLDWQECFGALRSKTDGRPLSGYSVHLRDTATERDLGYDTTNRLGRFAMRYPASPAQAGKTSKSGIQLELSVSPPGGEVIHRETIRLKPGQPEYGDILLPEADTMTKNAMELAASESPNIPAFLAKYLSDPGARTFSRSAGAPASQSWKEATSPRSYLSDLLDYTLKYLRQSLGGGDPTALTLTQLSTLLYQPFEVLLNSNAIAEQPLRQIRLCIEGLRALLGARPLSEASKEAALASAEAAWRTTAYESLLVHLGVSPESMSNLGTADEAIRNALADRLGVAPDKLTNFYRLADSLTDAWLEETFGLRETNWNGLSAGVKSGDINNQINRWQLEGIEWNKTTDAGGKVYLRLSKPTTSTYLVEVFRDNARSILLSSGSIATAQGAVELMPYEESGVQGFIGLDYTNGGASISISAVPALLACRYQLAFARWQARYQADDPEGFEFLDEQYQTAFASLETAIEKTEIAGLAALRDALVATIGQPLRQLSERLLLDCEFDATFQTSRTTQSITTLQQLLGGLRTGMLQDTFPGLQFTALAFDEEWTWLNTYDNWRSAIFVFLYPENALDPTLRRWQTPAFISLVETFRSNRQLDGDMIQKVVSDYTKYFTNVCQMEIEATCQASTQFDTSNGSIARNILYMFGMVSNSIYWSTVDTSLPLEEQQSIWEIVPAFEGFSVTRLLGAVPFRTIENRRYLYIFVKGAKKSKYSEEDFFSDQMNKDWSLAFITFDLLERKWAETITYLSKPEGLAAVEHTAVIEQRSGEEYPPHLIFQSPAKIQSRHFNKEGTDWSDLQWKTLLSGNDVPLLNAFFRNESYFHLYGISKTEFHSGRPCLYVFDKNENYSKYVDVVNVINADFAGATISSNNLIFYFYNRGGKTYYRSIKGSMPVEISTEISGPVGLTRVAFHIGMSKEIVQPAEPLKEGFRVVYKNNSGQQGFYQAFFHPDSSNKLNRYYQTQILPFNVTWFDLAPKQPFDTGSERLQGITDAFNRNSAAPAYILNYLWESYFFFPLYLSKQFEHSRQYGKALDYFRLVYDYSLPVGNRKIFFGLQQEENLSESYERPPSWLSDPLNPHHIATTRKQTYSRYTLLALTRLCLQAADAEFVRDTAESLAFARAWYTQSLELLQSPEFQQGQVNWGLSFTVPKNPVMDILGFYAEVSLYKLHTGRNIAGDEREVPLLEQETADNLALQGFGDYRQTIVPASGVQRPTAYRFVVLLERAKQLAGMAQQIEAAFLSALEKLDAERLQLLHAKNELQTAKATIRLQDLRVKEARDGVSLAEWQKSKSTFQRDYFIQMIQVGLSMNERQGLESLESSGGWGIFGGIAGAIVAGATAFATGGAGLAIIAGAGGIASTIAGAHSSDSSYNLTMASFERRRQEWEFQSNLASFDIQISNQQVRIAQDQVQIVGQERNIAALRSDQAALVANFLATKFTNADLYDFMSDVLEGVYSFFLQQATATAQMAALQLAFERQEPVPAVVLADYWAPPSRDNGASEEKADRRGITGSVRLLQDIQRLDQIAFQTDQRKLQLSKTISLAQLSPAEFQRFRETGVFPFHIPLEAFDRDFPGHYLRLIRQVRASVIALIPPIEGIRATLTNNGISRVVLSDNGRFTETVIRRPPESIAFTAPLNANGLFELQAENGKLLPFESMGVDGFWELQLPKAANAFDYNSIADVLLTVEYTALNNADYRRQVIASLDRRFSGDRAFSFRRDLPDQWYDLNHPEQSNEPMIVQFNTLRGDFPANVEGLKIQQVVLYIARKDGFQQEMKIKYLRFQPEDGALIGGSTDQNLDTVNGILSTRSGSFPAWDEFRGETPVGVWSLALADSPEMRQWLREEQIEDILFVLTVEGETPAWPERGI